MTQVKWELCLEEGKMGMHVNMSVSLWWHAHQLVCWARSEYLLQKLLEILTESLTSWPLADIVMKQWMVLSCKQIKVYR